MLEPEKQEKMTIMAVERILNTALACGVLRGCSITDREQNRTAHRNCRILIP